jgi:hypothetical protein
VSTNEQALDPNGDAIFVENFLQRSSYIRMALNEFQKNQPFTQDFKDWLYFGGGSNGSLNANLDAEVIKGYRLYDNSEEFDVNIFIDAGKSETVKRELAAICEERKDCMAILDCPESLVLYNKGFEVTDLVD